MEAYSQQNKKAWEYSAYEFWVKTAGTPSELAEKLLHDPKGMLKRYAKYFERYKGIRVANICGSCGKKAIPLAVLGADMTIFDISKENQTYALETAGFAGVKIGYEVCDVLEIDMERYAGQFDIVFMEGGILHYFHDIGVFMGLMYRLLKPGGRMICSDFHPFTKIRDFLGTDQQVMSYFSTEEFEGEMAHARFYDAEIRGRMPQCSYRKYTVSEIINAVIDSGFILRKFDEHPSWIDETVPGEFTLVVDRN